MHQKEYLGSESENESEREESVKCDTLDWDLDFISE